VRLQSSQAACGRAACSNALKALGVDVSEQQIDKLLKEIKKVGDEHAADGTGADTMARALAKAPRYWGIRAPRLVASHDPSMACAVLRGLLTGGSVVVLAVDLDAHWIAVIGAVGDRFLVCDAADDELVLSYSEDEMVSRWASESSPHGPLYSGLAIRRKK